MKRQSKAEEALIKQIKIIQNDVKTTDMAIGELSARRAAKYDILMQLQDEVDKIKDARIRANERNKP